MQFWNITVSQGSAATSLRYGGMYNAHFVSNFVQSLEVLRISKID